MDLRSDGYWWSADLVHAYSVFGEFKFLTASLALASRSDLFAKVQDQCEDEVTRSPGKARPGRGAKRKNQNSSGVACESTTYQLISLMLEGLAKEHDFL